MAASATMTKLSDAQRDMLAWYAGMEDRSIKAWALDPTRKPSASRTVAALIRLGMMEIRPNALGTRVPRITDAGREAIRDEAVSR